MRAAVTKGWGEARDRDTPTLSRVPTGSGQQEVKKKNPNSFWPVLHETLQSHLLLSSIFFFIYVHMIDNLITYLLKMHGYC